jgi:Flp pilus assembly protein TadB
VPVMYLLVINTVFLVCSTVLLAYLSAKKINIGKVVLSSLETLGRKNYERNLRQQVKKYTKRTSDKTGFVEGIEIGLIDRSNIRRYVPFANIYVLIAVSTAIFAAVFRPVHSILLFVPSTVVICFLISLMPFFILDLMGRYNSEKIRKKLAGFISVLSRWCAVKEDIFFAFDRSTDSGLGEPLKTFIRETVIQVNMGVMPADALDMLQMKVDNAQFKDFILNIKKSIEHRGDILKLLTNLEEQFYKIEEEYNRRKISTYRDRVVIYMIMFGVLATAYFFLKLNPDVEAFYLQTLKGKFLLTLFCFLYTAGFAVTVGISKFKY